MPFKVCRCKEKSIPVDVMDGCVYMCTDSKNIFMDWVDGSGARFRSQMNAEYANKLRYYIANNEFIELDASVIAEHLSNNNNPHGLTAEQLGLYVATVSDVKSYLGI